VGEESSNISGGKEMNTVLWFIVLTVAVLLVGGTYQSEQIKRLDKQVNLLTQQTMSLLIKQGYEAERSGR
jgi:hypothetical protein